MPDQAWLCHTCGRSWRGPSSSVCPNHEPCCNLGPAGHTRQEHHDASACYDLDCAFDHPKGGPYPGPENTEQEASDGR